MIVSSIAGGEELMRHLDGVDWRGFCGFWGLTRNDNGKDEMRGLSTARQTMKPSVASVEMT
jgi:hypothetical protein